MPLKKKKITCCHGRYHIIVDGTFYCMAPPDVACAQLQKGRGRFTRAENKIYYCTHNQHACADCSALHNKLNKTG